MTVSKWGNSLAVRIPAQIVELLELQEGDDIEIIVDSMRTFVVRQKESRAEIIARLEKYRGTLPRGFKFDRDDANAR